MSFVSYLSNVCINFLTKYSSLSVVSYGNSPSFPELGGCGPFGASVHRTHAYLHQEPPPQCRLGVAVVSRFVSSGDPHSSLAVLVSLAASSRARCPLT